MESAVRLPKEHARESGSTPDSSVLSVTYKKFDRSQDVVQACAILWEAWYKVNDRDLSYIVEPVILDNIRVPMQAIEAQLYRYLHEGCSIQLAYQNNDIIGVLVYHPIFENIIAIRMLYVQDQHAKLGKGLVQSIGIDLKKVIFQTRKDSPPDKCLKVTEPYRKLISEDETLYTWEMDWKRG